jgi:hypothetical protein
MAFGIFVTQLARCQCESIRNFLQNLTTLPDSSEPVVRVDEAGYF